MTWRQWLHARSRDETALQRLVAGILLAGFLAGVLVDAARNAFEGDRRPADAAAPENLASSADAAAAWRDAQRAAERGAWREVATGVGETWRRSWAADAPTLLAVAGGVCWLVFLLQAGQTFGDPPRVVALLAGVALGVASIAPTLFFSLWQEFAWGLAESDQGLPGVRFYVLGVGLREEAAKLLCGAALLPWLAFRRDELAALIAFAGVGLGFAAAENVRYIAATGGAATLGRLLTPLPFHVALTGLAGVHLYRACRRPQEQAAPCAAVLLAVVVAHGLYDAALGLPQFQDYAFAAMAIFIVAVRQFFHALRSLRGPGRDVVSLTATFLTCVCLAAAAAFVVLSAQAGWRTAAHVLAASLLAEALMVYLFLREMPESLVRT